MAKSKIYYVCENCGEDHPKWSGKCSSCGSWNTLVEFKDQAVKGKSDARVLEAKNVAELQTEKEQRLSSSINQLDELLGGGIVKGGVYLISGEPGIGKSTLLMQVSLGLAKQSKVLYVSGEESAYQVGLRAKRLGFKDQSIDIVNSTSADDIAQTIARGDYQLVVVDSIQTLTATASNSLSGSVSQIGASLGLISRAAKQAGVSLFVVGHITKDGNIAGPKLLEHMVDVVLLFEGDRSGGLRALKSLKNRFGPTHDLILFDMLDEGLKLIENPSSELLKNRQVADGSVVLASVEGSRAVLVEVQALVNATSFGYPKRAASGFNLNRLNLLAAVLTRRTKLNLNDKDIYLNVAGGFTLDDPGADLAVCMAIASAAKSLKLKDDAVVFGEVGLSGELRAVSHADIRIKEANKMGFKTVLGPNQAMGIEQVKTLKEALNKYIK